MGPKKDAKKDATKRDKGAENEKKWNIDDNLNSDTWRCVVVLAVERTQPDCFVLEEFREEAYSGRRKAVTVIDFEKGVLKILQDFAKGELSYKYSVLLSFSSLFQEAIYYTEKQREIPAPVLAKVVKALLFYMREENILQLKNDIGGSPDPIKAMAERPFNYDAVSTKKKDTTKKGDNNPKVRPPSVTKEDTKLLKRGERTKDDYFIDDGPRNAYFNLYVLLTGFYNPEFPLELIKANVPLHSVLCIDTSMSGVKRDASFEQNTFQKSLSETKPLEIQNFWDVFLKRIWDPAISYYFKDIVFQMYTPRRLLCEKKKLAEFIYREISYLMYDLSDLKRQLNNYLEHLRLWDMSEKAIDISGTTQIWPENIPEECVTVPIVLQCIIDAICDGEWKGSSSSSDSTGSEETTVQSGESGSLRKYYSSNQYVSYDPCAEDLFLGWSQLLEERGDLNLLNIYYKIKELDLEYDLGSCSVPSDDPEKAIGGPDSIQGNLQCQKYNENVQENLLPPNGAFHSYWKYYNYDIESFAMDYCLYAFLMTKVLCPYQKLIEESQDGSSNSAQTSSQFEPSSNFSEMRKPYYTVTNGSRSILKAGPQNRKNISKDFFSPEEFKVVSPEKVNASSAPEFRVSPIKYPQKLYRSEIFSLEITKNPFENLKELLSECLFLNTNDFDFLEFLSKPRLLEKEEEHWSNYNCVDHTYCILNDCILLRLHNRKDGQNVHHETFNQVLRTTVGLRDFYEYVLEDEKEWITMQEDLYQANAFVSNALIVRDSYKDFTDADFWMQNSLKFNAPIPLITPSKKEVGVKTEPSTSDRMRARVVHLEDVSESFTGFEGYNVSNMAVQFSGIKTVYYAFDCIVTVQLTEWLYGNQNLGIHVSEAYHSLHLHSYVCPEPHVIDPFTFHVSYKNGVILAFCRRFVETVEEIHEKVESSGTVKSKKNSSEYSLGVIKRHIPKTAKDENFVYDMVASLPNGLSIRTVRRIIEPCYIKQSYLVDNNQIPVPENSRLFLPNGDVVKMMNNGTVEILKVNATIIRANLSDLTSETESGNLSFSRFEVVSGDGLVHTYEDDNITSSKRIKVFQNTDMSENQIFFRRKDGTNYMLENDGTISVQFEDGTKMSSMLLLPDKQDEEMKSPSIRREIPDGRIHLASQETSANEEDTESDFVFVFVQIIAEHPDYATVTYDSQTQIWKILLPYDSTITIETNGEYLVELDSDTGLKVEADFLRMNSFSCEGEPLTTFTADLSVFENKEGGVYCRLSDCSGKTFIVEANSNCYILEEDMHSGARNSEELYPETSATVGPKESEQSEFVASADLEVCPSIPAYKNNKLLPENKYFILKRDVTGAEVLHIDDIQKALTKTQKGSLVFTQIIPGTENRCFVLVTPVPKGKTKKWAVESILPNPKYEPGKIKKASSTTYGVPPSWMHPFPKRKYKFEIPQPLTCRVFIETKKTEFSPPIGTLDCYFCEINDVTEVKHSEIPEGGIQEYLKRLANDDQDMLTEMYSRAAATVINEKKKLKPQNSEKLQHYLELSRHFVAMREYHEKCIRYHIIPNYFHHPAGMCWLILNDLLLRCIPRSDPKIHKQALHFKTIQTDGSEVSISGFSNEEIEYNISHREEQSFSSLSYRSDISAQTAPPVLRTGGVCTCKINPAKDTVSCPVLECSWKSATSIVIESEIKEDSPGICAIEERDMQLLGRTECVRETSLMSLEDLMYLGLI